MIHVNDCYLGMTVPASDGHSLMDMFRSHDGRPRGGFYSGTLGDSLVQIAQ